MTRRTPNIGRLFAIDARWMLIVALCGAIFVADTLTNFEIAVAVFYVAVVLVGAAFLPTSAVLAISGACVVLSLISLTLTQAGTYNVGLINCALSICAIVATTYLALSRSSALLAEHEARTQLARLARVNSLGEMTASIAHEINQPLAAIVTSGNASLNWLATDPPNTLKVRQAVERMIGDANRASDIVNRIRTLSKHATVEAEWIDAVALLDEALDLCRSELSRNGIAVETKAPDGPCLIFADAVQIQQVLLNLVLNAVEAMSDTPASHKRIFVGISHVDPKLVEFAICDTGRGIDGGKIETIFDAFYTTKTDGMGLGLAISRTIIEAHGGRIWVTADPKGGAMFHFTLIGRKSGTA